jgi:hypothetical protein
VTAEERIDSSGSFEQTFPLLNPVAAEAGRGLRRFTVTQLLNFQRCARQYYFERMLRTPGKEERNVWNDAEAPEPPANLTATLKGAVIHRFCETFREGDDVEARLTASFEDVLSQRQAELAGRSFDIDKTEAVRALMPLAQNYLVSGVFQRVADTQRLTVEDPESSILQPRENPGLWSELRFRLRRRLGILTGTIDKLLITSAANGAGLDVEIIDFKTNRFAPQAGESKPHVNAAQAASTATKAGKVVNASRAQPAQAAFDFEAVEAIAETGAPLLPMDQITAAADDYRLQMQAYALAVRELLRAGTRSQGEPVEINSLRATLHFIDPNVEISLPSSLLDSKACAAAIDSATRTIALLDGSLDPDQFPPLPATHCRMCNFLDLCPAGRDWLRGQ